MAGGRPSKYNGKYHPQLVYYMALGGMIDTGIAKELNISVSTLNKWKKDYPEFSESLKRGKEDPDNKVIASLLKSALGYEHPEDKIFNQNGIPLVVPTIKHYPPNSTSIIFWLKNRLPENWRDKQELAVTEHNITVSRESINADND